jgi:excisionase family DNA binding protein
MQTPDATSSELQPRRRSAADPRTLDDAQLVAATVARDGAAWCELMHRYAPALRDAALDADSTLSETEIDEVLSDLWLSLIENNMARLRTFDVSRGSALLSWLTIRLSQIVFKREQDRADAPPILPLREARQVAALPPAPRRNVGGDPPLMRVDDVAKRWGLDRKTIYAMIERGQLGSRRCGRLVRIPRNVVESFESQASVDPDRGTQCR